MVRLALIGIDHSHARDYQETLLSMGERVEVVGIWGPRLDTLPRSINRAYAQVPVYQTLDEMIRRARPEAAMAFLRGDEAGPILSRLAEAKVHVWAEKPVARRAADLAPARDTLNRHGLVFGTGYTWRFASLHRQVKRWVSEGLFGTLTGATVQMANSSVTSRNPHSYLFSHAVSGGGILMWLGCHWLDLLHFLTGERVEAVTALTATLSGEPIDVEDVAAVALRFQGGALATLHAGYLTPKGEAGGGTSLRLYGQRGWAVWQNRTAEVEAYSADPSWSGEVRRVSLPDPPAPGYGTGGRRTVEAFLDAVAGSAPPTFRIEDAMHVLAVVEAAYESARTGRVVAPVNW